MSDDSSMSVKAYLDIGDGRQEVRRFGMPENVATNFACLKEKICNVFALGRKDITLTWKDSEGDSIIISSDEELVEAIADSMSKQKMQVFRININLGHRANVGSNDAVPGNQQGDLHESVVCDVCNGPVVGFRYRCVTCADFDLCGACETKGRHKEHKMIRSPKPRLPGEPNFWWKEEHGPRHYGTHFGMHGGTGGNTFSCSSSSATAGAGPGVGIGVGLGTSGGEGGEWSSWGPWGGWGGRGRRCGRRGREFGGWGGWFGKGGEGGNGGSGGGCWQGSGHTVGGMPGQRQQQKENQQNKPQQQQQEEANYQQQANDCDNNDTECPWTDPANGSCPFPDGPTMPNPERIAEEARFAAQEASKMAQHVAHHFASQMASDQVANVMRGIWTAWSGQQPPVGGPSIPGSQPASASPTEASSSSSSAPSVISDRQQEVNIDSLGIDDEVPCSSGIRQRCSLSEDDIQSRQSLTNRSPTSATPPAGPSSVAKSSNMDIQTDGSGTGPAEMEVCRPPEVENQMESDVEDWTLVNRDSQSPEGRSAANRMSQCPEERVEQSISADASERHTHPPTERRVQYPNLSEFQRHPDPAIQQALEHMQTMGYSNEGGWLSNLLEMKQGDINQVLDLLQPINK